MMNRLIFVVISLTCSVASALSRPSQLRFQINTRAFASSIPSHGISDYIGNTSNLFEPIDSPEFHTSRGKVQLTRWNLFRQYPWKRIKGKFILKAKIGGELPLEAVSSGFSFAPKDPEPVESLTDLINLFNYAAHDPRVQAVFIEIDRFACGYAKLIELRRIMNYFRKSGKEIIGYCSSGAEKEIFVGLSCDQFFIPPDGGLDLRGFSGGATFFRGIFDKIGIEPQVQRIGKYKSFGDTFNRTSISDAQREVISSLLMESSNYWASSVATGRNKTTDEVMKLWADAGIKEASDFCKMGYVSGVCYLDQVEGMLKVKYGVQKKPNVFKKISLLFKSLQPSSSSTTNEIMSDINDADDLQEFNLLKSFEKQPRRRSRDYSGKILNTTSTLFGPLDNNMAATSSTSSLSESVNDSSPVTELTESVSSEARDTVPSPGFASMSTEVSDAVGNELIGTDAVATDAVTTTEEEKDMEPSKDKDDFQDARGYPAGQYLRKMRKGGRILAGLRVKEALSGPRIAIINAVGGIGSGKSSRGPTGVSLGSDSLIAMLRVARQDSSIKGVVLRVDSPGGSALASDLMWRELRRLSKEKPVIASMVDVAASGGYYLGMGCDEIVAEELTVTGSIGVVTAKFNAEELNNRIGYNTETISRGRYAEVLSTSRGFTDEESAYFEQGAQNAYKSFITKAAASRNMTVEALHEVAQGRVWTGRQALNIGLVDHIGGLWKALSIAAAMSDIPDKWLKSGLRVQTLRDPSQGGLKLPFGASSISQSSSSVSSPLSGSYVTGSPLLLCDDSIVGSGLAGAESLGMNPVTASMGIGPLFAYVLNHSPTGRAVRAVLTAQQDRVGAASAVGGMTSMWAAVKGVVVDFLLDL